MVDIFAFGLGIARYSASGTMLDCFFPQPLLKPGGVLAQAVAELPTGASEIDEPGQVPLLRDALLIFLPLADFGIVFAIFTPNRPPALT